MRKPGSLLSALVCAAAVALVAAGVASAAGTPPSNIQAPSISGTVGTGNTLTADPGVWSGTQPITYAYQWESCDSNGDNCTNIAGATASTYTVKDSDIGNTFRVIVTATDANGSAPATSALARFPKVTLAASKTLVVYGSKVLFTGSVANGTAGETVTIVGRPYPFTDTSKPAQVAKALTTDGGAFSVMLKPTANTAYYAEIGGSQSTTLSVNVRPRLVVQKMGLHRFAISVKAAKPLTGRRVLIQRYNQHKHLWVSVERVTLRGSLSSATISLPKLGGAMVRIFLPLKGVVPGYVDSTSSAFTA